MVKKERFETRAVHGCQRFDEKTGAISFPIYQNATFRHPGLNETTGYDYSRLQNPTREELEKTVATLEEGKYGLAFATGMAAISTVLKLVKPGQHMIVSEDLYGGVYRALETIYEPYGIEVTYVDLTDVEAVEGARKEHTVMLWIESPTNPMMREVDFEKLVQLAQKYHLLTVVDNTFLTPYYQKPLSYGIDIVVHSGTKYLSGHNDTLAGIIVLNNDVLAERLRLIQATEGGVLAPFDSWLMLRGLKTLHVRMETHTANGRKIAAYLTSHPKVENVHYVGKGGMIAFTVPKQEWVQTILNSLQLICFAESLGGCESLMTYPTTQTHQSIPEAHRERVGVTNRLLRLSVGIENSDDLIEDLEQALEVCL